ncbi:MAG: helix-turn-helix domain-containing protein [Methanocellales archaeon]|nr:helix-turn-helix domain-containing protein [Methanocellales archaeon]
MSEFFVLSKILGGSPQVKILETFCTYPDDELTVPEVTRIAELVKATVYKYIQEFVDEGIIKKTRKIGRTQMYKLNGENSKAKIMTLLMLTIEREGLAEMITKKEKISGITPEVGEVEKAKA